MTTASWGRTRNGAYAACFCLQLHAKELTALLTVLKVRERLAVMPWRCMCRVLLFGRRCALWGHLRSCSRRSTVLAVLVYLEGAGSSPWRGALVPCPSCVCAVLLTSTALYHVVVRCTGCMAAALLLWTRVTHSRTTCPCLVLFRMLIHRWRLCARHSAGRSHDPSSFALAVLCASS
jgi:hypothetical protein